MRGAQYLLFAVTAIWGFGLIWTHAGFPVALGCCLLMIALEVKPE